MGQRRIGREGKGGKEGKEKSVERERRGYGGHERDRPPDALSERQNLPRRNY